MVDIRSDGTVLRVATGLGVVMEPLCELDSRGTATTRDRVNPLE